MIVHAAHRLGRDLVLAVSPLGVPEAAFVTAVDAAGGRGVLDLGAGDAQARRVLDRLAAEGHPLAVRIGPGSGLTPEELCSHGSLHTVVLAPGAGGAVERFGGVVEGFGGARVLAEVSVAEHAVRAVAEGVHGIVVRGHEATGSGADPSAFILLQQVLDRLGDRVPVWVWGGIGRHTAVAAVAAGAAGVVLSTQLALLEGSAVPEVLAAAVARADGHGPETIGVSGGGAPGGRPSTVRAGEDAALARQFAALYGSVAEAVRGVRQAVLDTLPGWPDAAELLAPDAGLTTGLGTRLPVVQGPMSRVSDSPGFALAVARAGAMPVLALALASGERSAALLAETRQRLAGLPWGVGLLGFAEPSLAAAQLAAVREHRPHCVVLAGGRPDQAAALEADGIPVFLHTPSPILLQQYLRAGVTRFVFEGSECGGHVGPASSFVLWEQQCEVLRQALAERQGRPGRLELLFAGGIHDARSAAAVAALAAPLAARGAAVGILMGTAYLFTQEAVTGEAIGPVFQQRLLAATDTRLLPTGPGHRTRCLSSPFVDEFDRTARELAEAGVAPRQVSARLEELNLGRLRLASKGLRREGGQLRPVPPAEQDRDGLFMAGQVAALRSTTTTVAALHEEVTTGAGTWLRSRADDLQRGADDAAAAAGPASPARRPGAVASGPGAVASGQGTGVAVIGMACAFPQAPDLGAYWSLVVHGRDAVTEVPPDRWDPRLSATAAGEESASASGSASGSVGERPLRSRSRWGGFLPPIPFDPLRFGIPPASLASIDPAQLLALEMADRALRDAGYPAAELPAQTRQRTAVVFAAEAGGDLHNAAVLRTTLPAYLGDLPPRLAEALPSLTEDLFPGTLANVISGRVANRLDLGGANYAVDAACASSLAAVDLACKELGTGTSDLVLCGAADLHNSIHDYLLFTSVGALSATGRSRPFDVSADGIALGEGVACLVLKRLADAERDGDRVYAVIRGVGAGSDGRALGLTAPRPEGQRRALTRAYAAAGIGAAEVGLVEAHGTGTVVGDRTELATLEEVLGDAGAAPGTVSLGSVKSQIGHTKCAAGLAGLIKAVLAVHHGVFPPTLHLSRPNPAWDPARSPLAFRTEAAPWADPPGRRLAGVSAFGFGGTNYHVVVGGHAPAGPASSVGVSSDPVSSDPVSSGGAWSTGVPGQPDPVQEWPAELFLFTGPDEGAAADRMGELLTRLERGPGGRLRDWAFTWARGQFRGQFRGQSRLPEPVWFAVVATDLQELAALLRRARRGEHAPAAGLFRAAAVPSGARGPVAVLFPGQGSQRPGMFADLFVALPQLRHLLRPGGDGAEAPPAPAGLFPPAAFDPAAAREQAELLRDTRNAQPALGMTGLAALHLLDRLGVRPEHLGGHSYGELVAVCAAGAIPPRALIGLSRARAQALLAAVREDDPGAMAAVPAAPAEVAARLAEIDPDGRVCIANHNAPRQTVIAGATSAVEQVSQALAGAGLVPTRLRVACAFHSPLVAGAGDGFASALAGAQLRAPEVTVWSNRTARPYPQEPDRVRAELAAQLEAPVLFADQIEAMYAAGARVFVEAGPGTVLSGLVTAVLGDRPHLSVPLEYQRAVGIRGFLLATAALAVAGCPLDTGWLHQGRGARDLTDGGTARPGWTVDGHLVRTADGVPVRGGLTPARPLREITMSLHDVTESPEPTITAPAGGGADHRLVAQFLDLGREIVAAQRDVLLRYLGGGGGRHAPGDELPGPAQPASLTLAPPGEAGPGAVGTTGSGAEGLLDLVLAVIGERTGYPVAMIEPDLDLEAELSVDSIKRTEIVGLLLDRLGLLGPGSYGAAAELPAAARTAGGIAAWLAGLGRDDHVAASGSSAPSAPAPSASAPAPIPVTPRRYEELPVVLDGELADPAEWSGAGILLLTRDGGSPLTRELVATLIGWGAEVTVTGLDGTDPVAGAPIDDVILLTEAPDDRSVLPAAFPALQAALAAGIRRLFCVSRADGPAPAGSGLRGFVRTVAREYPHLLARAVELPPDLTAEQAARCVAEELLHPEPTPVTLHRGGRRYGLDLVPRDLPPARQGAVADLGLDRDAVLLVVGGGRGITAQAGVAMAAACGARVEVAGRTAWPGAPDPHPHLLGVDDLRAALLDEPGDPAQVEARVREILAGREVSATLRDLEAHASSVRYHVLDVTDTDAVQRTVEKIHAEHGRLDAVVYGAGLIADALVTGKDPESFRRVFATKVDGAAALLDALDRLPERPRFVVLYGSIAAVRGNRGQADYAAANDALEHLGRAWAERTGVRVLTVHWGPWAPLPGRAGMVTPQLSRHLARLGTELVDPGDAVGCLLRELAEGDPTTRAVVYTGASW